MSEQKWTVLKEWGRGGWIVVHPGDIRSEGDGRPEFWAVHSQHDTWAEAMQEADHMARTVTVTLPANPDRVMPVTTIRTHGEPEGTWTERTYKMSSGQDITIPDAYREPLALALLAHARKETN